MRRITKTDLERFEAKFTIEANGCWIWNGCKSSRYGAFYFPNFPGKFSKDMVSAHKSAYYLYKQIVVERPDEVMHSCDNGFCCNPEHLSVGSHKDNMADMVKKGRSKASKQVLTKEDVEEARRLRSFGMQVKEISKIFKISSSQMSRVVKGVLPKFTKLKGIDVKSEESI